MTHLLNLPKNYGNGISGKQKHGLVVFWSTWPVCKKQLLLLSTISRQNLGTAFAALISDRTSGTRSAVQSSFNFNEMVQYNTTLCLALKLDHNPSKPLTPTKNSGITYGSFAILIPIAWTARIDVTRVDRRARTCLWSLLIGIFFVTSLLVILRL